MKAFQLRTAAIGSLWDSKMQDAIDAVFDPSQLFMSLGDAKKAAQEELDEMNCNEEGADLEELWTEIREGSAHYWECEWDNEWAARIYETEIAQ